MENNYLLLSGISAIIAGIIMFITEWLNGRKKKHLYLGFVLNTLDYEGFIKLAKLTFQYDYELVQLTEKTHGSYKLKDYDLLFEVRFKESTPKEAFLEFMNSFKRIFENKTVIKKHKSDIWITNICRYKYGKHFIPYSGDDIK